jgi:hypothetical protein
MTLNFKWPRARLHVGSRQHDTLYLGAISLNVEPCYLGVVACGVEQRSKMRINLLGGKSIFIKGVKMQKIGLSISATVLLAPGDTHLVDNVVSESIGLVLIMLRPWPVDIARHVVVPLGALSKF